MNVQVLKAPLSRRNLKSQPRILLPVLALILLMPAVNLTARAQSGLAQLQGTIRDASGRVVPGARILLRDTRTGLSRRGISNRVGQYSFPSLAPDPYALQVTAQGFRAARRQFTLEVNQHLLLDVPLAVHSMTVQTVVVGRSAVLRTASASLGEVIEPKMVRDLPLNGGHLLDLALLAPGVHGGSGAQTGTANPLYWRPEQNSALVAGGARDNANVYLLDGATDTDPTFGTLTLSPAVDAVREFKVQTGSYSAEFGGGGGAQINMITRSGSNRWHGDIYEYLRNSALDARTWNDVGGRAPGKTPHLAQNQFGGSLGGPIQSNRTFFFVNLEGFRLGQDIVNFDTVPTLAERRGNFSQSGHQIYDPSSTYKNPNYNPNQPVSSANPQYLRNQFSGNIIPRQDINPVSAAVLQYVPLPNMAQSGPDSNNYYDVRGQTDNSNQATIRIDHNFRGGNLLMGRYSIEHETDFVPQNLPGFGINDNNQAQNFTVSYTRILSSSSVDRIWVAMSRLSMHRYSQDNFGANLVQQLGIQGVGYGGYGAYGLPYFNLQGYTGFGDSFAATPVQDWDTVAQIGDIWNYQLGRHSLKIGGDYRRFFWPMWGFFENRGYYQFTNGFTTRTLTNDGTGSAFASYLLGLPVVKQVQQGVPSMDLLQWYGDAFIQDDWRMNSRTTLDLGLRYEYMSPLWDTEHEGSNLEFINGKSFAFIGGQSGMPAGLMYANKLNFAPRFGFTRQVGWDMVLRGSFGIFFTPVDMNTWCDQRHNPPEVFQVGQQSDNFTPSLNGYNFAPAVLGKTPFNFSAFTPHSPAQQYHQWSLSLQKRLGRNTVLEIGYTGARGYHLQQMVLVNNAPPGPGPINPRRPYQTATYLPGTTFPAGFPVSSLTFPIAAIAQLQNTANSWYDAGWVDLRRRFTHGLTFLSNFTWSKNLTTAPDFRSPMSESALPQNNSNLAAEKGPACDVPLRYIASFVYNLPAWGTNHWLDGVTRNWNIATIFQAQSGYPLTIQVFGDTANAGTLLGENPIRANVTGAPLYPAGTHTTARWFNPAAFATPAAYTFGDAGRNSIYGPGYQDVDLALTRAFDLSESTQFQFRTEFFNALNHSNYSMPNNFVNTPQFGTITTAANPGREIQFGARLVF